MTQKFISVKVEYFYLLIPFISMSNGHSIPYQAVGTQGSTQESLLEDITLQIQQTTGIV